jgi:hypothetical protein
LIKTISSKLFDAIPVHESQSIELGLDCFNCTLISFIARPHCVSNTGQSFTPTPVDRKDRNLFKCYSTLALKLKKKKRCRFKKAQFSRKHSNNDKGAVVKDTDKKNLPVLILFLFLYKTALHGSSITVFYFIYVFNGSEKVKNENKFK